MAQTEQTHNPPFSPETRQFSDDEFKKHISFLKLPLAKDEFSGGMLEKLKAHGITDYKTFFSKDIGLDHRYYEGYFSFPITIPIVYNEDQKKLLGI